MFSGLFESKHGSQARTDSFFPLAQIIGYSLQRVDFGPSSPHFHVETYVRHPKIYIPM